MTDFDGPALLGALAARSVRYVLIGGFAAVVHGSPLPTRDIDITPDPDSANLQRLSEALTDLEARVRVPGVPEGLPFRHDADSLRQVPTLNLTTKFGDLDIALVPDGTGGYRDLARDALTIRISGTEVRVASLADVIRSKAATGRDKDRRALGVLREILATRSAVERPSTST